MTDLERRALLGDAEAQRECTEKGIVLPCPFCGGHATIKVQNVQYGLSGTIISCKRCMAQLYSPDKQAVSTPSGVHKTHIENHKEIGIGRWNRRTDPPIGRCGECKFYDTFDCPTSKTGYTEKAMKYCSWFEPKGGEENEAD